MSHLLAVYGTLKKNQYNHYLLKNSPLKFSAHTGNGFQLYLEEIPYLSRSQEGKGCEIEVYEISEDTLELLDQLEGHPEWYRREVLSYHENQPVWIYISQREDLITLKKIDSF